MHMAIYKIMRIYEVPADNQIEATNRMMEALVLHVEGDYHVTDYVKAPEDPDGKGRPIDLTPPKGWLSSMVEELVTQLTGNGWKKPQVYKGKSMHQLELEKKKR